MANAFGLTGLVRPSRITIPDIVTNGMPRWMKITDGDIIVPGIHAVLIAKRGFPGDRKILDKGSKYAESVGSDRYNENLLTAGLGEKYGILKTSMKAYPTCRYISAALDAVSTIISKHGVKTDDVDQVIVKTGKGMAKSFSVYDPAHMVHAQYSIPYTVAMVLSGEPAGPGWYTDSMLSNPEASKIQSRIKLEEDPEITIKYYKENRHTGTVEILTKDGKLLSEHVEYLKGTPENPFTIIEYQDKFIRMASWLGISKAQTKDLMQTLNHLETLEDISELTQKLVPR